MTMHMLEGLNIVNKLEKYANHVPEIKQNQVICNDMGILNNREVISRKTDKRNIYIFLCFSKCCVHCAMKTGAYINLHFPYKKIGIFSLYLKKDTSGPFLYHYSLTTETNNFVHKLQIIPKNIFS